jgi:Mor family transcriptional regulator
MTTHTLAEVITDALRSPDFAMPETTARILAEQIIRVAAARGHAGAEYYLPSMQPVTRAERNAMIRAEFNGRNLAAICKKYGVSRRTVYYACRRHS